MSRSQQCGSRRCLSVFNSEFSNRPGFINFSPSFTKKRHLIYKRKVSRHVLLCIRNTCHNKKVKNKWIVVPSDPQLDTDPVQNIRIRNFYKMLEHSIGIYWCCHEYCLFLQKFFFVSNLIWFKLSHNQWQCREVRIRIHYSDFWSDPNPWTKSGSLSIKFIINTKSSVVQLKFYCFLVCNSVSMVLKIRIKNNI
jgi:hypothetical protein